MVLTDDNFASIVAAIEEGRTVFSNLLKSLAFILPTNAGEGMIIIVALLGGYALPVTPVQILWINTVTAVTLALPLAFEPKEPGLMELPPRNPDAPLLSRTLIRRIIVVGTYMVIAGFAVFAYERQAGVPKDQARTAAVTTIVAIEMFYLFVARSERVSVLRLGLFSNPYVWIGVPIVIILQLAFVYVPTLNFLFSSSPPPGHVWAHILLASFPVTLVVSLEKALRRRFSPDET
jgi:Ca2+-transporting ATPase